MLPLPKNPARRRDAHTAASAPPSSPGSLPPPVRYTMARLGIMAAAAAAAAVAPRAASAARGGGAVINPTPAAVGASDGSWSIISANIGTICTGAAFISNTTGYLPVAANGVGTELLHTKNGGRTWTQAKEEPFALLLLDIAAFGSSVAVVGALTMEFSLNSGACTPRQARGGSWRAGRPPAGPSRPARPAGGSIRRLPAGPLAGAPRAGQPAPVPRGPVVVAITSSGTGSARVNRGAPRQSRGESVLTRRPTGC